METGRTWWKLPEHHRNFQKMAEISGKSWKKQMETCRTQRKLPEQ